MIKKFLLGLFISFVGLVGFSFAENWFGQGLVGEWATNISSQTYDVTVLRNGSLLSSVLGSTKDIFYISNDYMFFWGIDGKMNGYYPYAQYGGNLNNFYVCDYISGDFNSFTNCSTFPYTGESISIVNNALSKLKPLDLFFYGQSANSRYADAQVPFLAFNISNLNKSLLFNFSYYCPNNGTFYGVPCTWGNLSNNFQGSYNYSSLPSEYISISPVAGSNNNINEDITVGIPLNSVEGSINYFEENYGRNENICYAGINELTSIYGDPVSFDYGQGLNIFEVFSGLYGNDSIYRVYVWLNSWLLNYEQWYNTNGNPMYLSIYNSGTNQVDLYYDNLTFPFENQPVAINFLVSNIEDFSVYSTQGSEVVSYCNLKINDGTFEDILDQSTKNNINNYISNSNINNGKNPDGSSRGYDNIDAFLSSGVELAFSGDTTVSNTLKNFFTEFEEVLDLLDINTSTRILPSWLVTAFLFVVLFKLLRRKNG